MKCGFGPKGAKAKIRGVCPAAGENRLNGVHGGMNGGRACWFVDNTFACNKEMLSGDFSNKYPTCKNCDFYWHVKNEQGEEFEISLILNTYMQIK